MIGPILLLWVAPHALAAEPIVLSYDGALKQALDRNASLLGAQQDLRAAEGALLAAKGTFDPSLDGSAGWSSSTSESTREYGDVLSQFDGFSWNATMSEYFSTGTALSLEWDNSRNNFRYELPDTGIVVESETPTHSSNLTATLTQALLQGHKMSYNLQGVRTAGRARDAADLARLGDQQTVLADTALAYWALWYQERLVQIARQSLEVALEERRVVQARINQGQLAPMEMSRVEATVVQARSALIDAENASLAAAEALLLQLGEGLDQQVQLVTQPADVVEVEIDELSVVAAALANNPSVRVARLSEQGASEGLSNARHGVLPELSATGRYGLSGYEPSASAAIQELASGALPEWYLGANVSVPLGNRADRGALLSAQAELAKARIDREALERVIEAQVRAQVRTLESARVKVDLAEANLRFAEQTLAAQRALQTAGRAIQKDVLEAIKNVDNARVSLEKSKADFQLAVVELERLKGDL